MANEQTRQQSEVEAPAAAVASRTAAPAVPAVNWDDANMRTSYANVVNASSTREEVTIFFGTNLTWNPGEGRQFHVRLNDRIVLNPYAAKRLWVLLGALLKEYEVRFGPLKMDIPTAEPASRSNGKSTTAS